MYFDIMKIEEHTHFFSKSIIQTFEEDLFFSRYNVISINYFHNENIPSSKRSFNHDDLSVLYVDATFRLDDQIHPNILSEERADTVIEFLNHINFCLSTLISCAVDIVRRAVTELELTNTRTVVLKAARLILNTFAPEVEKFRLINMLKRLLGINCLLKNMPA